MATALQKQKFLEKIENDVSERIYDLLVVHLIGVHEKIKVYGETDAPYRKKLVLLLDASIKDLIEGINRYNALQRYRWILLFCNKLLTYESRLDIKKIKMKIVEEFTHAEQDTGERIPLNYQINELRITYDASYLLYLAKKLTKEKDWAKALYCTIAARLVEPDNEELEELYSEIKKNVKDETIKNSPSEELKDKTLVLDSNIVISIIMQDVGKFKPSFEEPFEIKDLEENNKIIITDSVEQEVKGHITYKLEEIKKRIEKLSRFSYSEIEKTIWKRYTDLLEKYPAPPIKVDPKKIEELKEEYGKHLNKLEEILMEKIKRQPLSSKLRKIAQRENLLPEEGDLKLMAEADASAKTGLNVKIITKDKDFLVL